MMMMMMSRARFSLVELLMAMAITATTACAMLSLVVAGQSIARLQPEHADQQQRARIAAQVIGDRARARGSGHRSRARRQARWRDGFRRISVPPTAGLTIWYRSAGGAQATLAAPPRRRRRCRDDRARSSVRRRPACRSRRRDGACSSTTRAAMTWRASNGAGPGWLVLAPGRGRAPTRGRVDCGGRSANVSGRCRRAAARAAGRSDRHRRAARRQRRRDDGRLLDGGRRDSRRVRFAPAVMPQLPDLAVRPRRAAAQSCRRVVMALLTALFATALLMGLGLSIALVGTMEATLRRTIVAPAPCGRRRLRPRISPSPICGPSRRGRPSWPRGRSAFRRPFRAGRSIERLAGGAVGRAALDLLALTADVQAAADTGNGDPQAWRILRVRRVSIALVAGDLAWPLVSGRVGRGRLGRRRWRPGDRQQRHPGGPRRGLRPGRRGHDNRGFRDENHGCRAEPRSGPDPDIRPAA